MVNFCAINGCSNRADREKEKSYYRLPKVLSHHGGKVKELLTARRTTWLSRISRADLTKEKMKYVRVCSDHFVKGGHKFMANVFYLIRNTSKLVPLD